MTYLEIVNKVLIRLRENEVTSVQDTPYSKLIGELVNVVKREVEDSWAWSALRTTVTVTTVASASNYTLTSYGVRTRLIDVINDTSNYALSYQTTKWFDKEFLITPLVYGEPAYYNLNGYSIDGFSKVDLYPVPNSVQEVRFNAVNPQVDLDDNADIIQVPYQIVIEGALARAISERGDDGGYTEQEARYQRIASDLIAFDAGNRPDETIWSFV